MFTCVLAFAQRTGKPGEFDYYLLTLSWSPQFCSGHSSDPQCSGPRKFGFVVHGMWPQFKNGSWPESCSAAPGLSNPDSMLDIMPSPHLIAHEWQKHGTCSGLDAKSYFGLTRQAFGSIHVPDRFQNPRDYVTVSVADLRRAFRDSNRALADDDFSVVCSGRQLSEVRICLDKQLRPTACRGRDRCSAGKLVLPPIR